MDTNQHECFQNAVPVTIGMVVEYFFYDHSLRSLEEPCGLRQAEKDFQNLVIISLNLRSEATL